MKPNEQLTVKPGLEEKYAGYVQKNQDEYGNACIVATAAVGKLLDEGKTPEEAEKGMHGFGITGFMAGAAAKAIVHFHPRGEEFKKFWNKHVGGTGAEEGTINPALVTIATKSKPTNTL